MSQADPVEVSSANTNVVHTSEISSPTCVNFWSMRYVCAFMLSAEMTKVTPASCAANTLEWIFFIEVCVLRHRQLAG